MHQVGDSGAEAVVLQVVGNVLLPPAPVEREGFVRLLASHQGEERDDDPVRGRVSRWSDTPLIGNVSVREGEHEEEAGPNGLLDDREEVVAGDEVRP